MNLLDNVFLLAMGLFVLGIGVIYLVVIIDHNNFEKEATLKCTNIGLNLYDSEWSSRGTSSITCINKTSNEIIKVSQSKMKQNKVKEKHYEKVVVVELFQTYSTKEKRFKESKKDLFILILTGVPILGTLLIFFYFIFRERKVYWREIKK